MMTSSSERMHPPFTEPFRSGFPNSRPTDLIHTLKQVRTDIFDTDKQLHCGHRCTLNLAAQWHIHPIRRPPPLSVTTRRLCASISFPSLMPRTASTPIQTSGTCRNPQHSTISAQLLSQSIHELETPSSALPVVHHLADHAAIQKPGYPSPMHTFSFQSDRPSAFLSLEMSNMVVNAMTKVAYASYISNMSNTNQGGSNEYFHLLPHQPRPAESWRVCHHPTVDRPDRPKTAQTAPG
jgi:hypothetical protein